MRRPTLRSRMNGVLVALGRLRASPDAEGVHDLRVAVRRCRALAKIMREVDPHPAWRQLTRRLRSLFHALGELRDLQVLEEWVGTLARADAVLRAALIEELRRREASPRERVNQAVEAFDRRAWRRLGRVLRQRGRLVAPDSTVAACLALERYLVLRRLHARALRIGTPASWHRLRLGVKDFRYAVEIVLPRRHAAWQDQLKQTQDLLGSMHDLHVLDAFVARESAAIGTDAAGSLHRALGVEIQSRVDRYREQTTGEGNVLDQWRAGLPGEEQIDAATNARLLATARAADPHVDRTTRITSLARQVFSAVAAASEDARWHDGRIRRTLVAAARLHGVRDGNRQASRQKAAFDILRALPVPIGWRRAEWETLAWTVRYHRGAEPKPTHVRFSRLPGERQDLVRGLAGVLRLARALHRAGVTAVSTSPHDAGGASRGVRLRAHDFIDSRKTAGRLAAAKHLLEHSLGQPVILEAG